MVPLKQEITELESQIDCLVSEKKLLQEEVDRWKTRTNQLIEQSKKIDPEDMKRLM